jgi:hypothetical protein
LSEKARGDVPRTRRRSCDRTSAAESNISRASHQSHDSDTSRRSSTLRSCVMTDMLVSAGMSVQQPSLLSLFSSITALDVAQPAQPYLNCRNVYGRIHTMVTTPPRRGEQIAPSLGDVVDSFLDCFGYSLELVMKLYDARVSSRTKLQFVARMNQYMARTEAGWFWDHSVVSKKAKLRVRTFEIV